MSYRLKPDAGSFPMERLKPAAGGCYRLKPDAGSFPMERLKPAAGG